MNDRAPVAAAIDRVIPSQSSTGMAVTLDGTHSSDADGDTLTYKWTGAFPEGNGTVTGPTPTVTLPMGASPITLIVNDGELDSASMATTVTVSSFKITAPLASASVQKGQAAPFEIQVSPQYGAFDAPVTLACPNLPASMTCRFSEASVTPGSLGSKVVLTISTAQSASLRSRYIYAFAFLLPASFLLVADSKRRRWMVLSVLVVALLAFLVACGSSGYVSINNGQLTAQVTVQSVTVTGTSGGLASSTGLTVTIKP
jgi:hypothetical protein